MEILESYTAGYSAENVSPHGITQRISITPPSSRRYHVTQMLLYLYRTEEATAQGMSRVSVNIHRAGASPYPIAIVDLDEAQVGAHAGISIMSDITLYPGDYLRAYTTDTSTGGRVSYWITINYDAIP